ncbi:hypothetical protein C4J81_17155 [Deltaproteobacteria bacterium Smac51]|nr:hypothetical protein C4J81_17155 [Deltaproteobacteria bacterium Smac51]
MSEETASAAATTETPPSDQPQAAPPTGETLLTQPDDSTAPAEPKEGETEAPATTIPENPDGYDLAFSDGLELDQELLTSFKTTAHELGITGPQAQKLAGMYESHVKALTEKLEAEQVARYQEAKDSWEAEIKKAPDFQANLGHAKRALAAYGSPELFTLLDQTLMGGHPAMFSFVSKVGKALAEPAFQGRGVSVSETDPAKILYPAHK